MKKNEWIVIISLAIVIIIGIGTTLETVSAIYDINTDGVVTFEDAALAWYNRESGVALYDVNSDGYITFEDAALIWYNIGTSETTSVANWFSKLIWG